MLTDTQLQFFRRKVTDINTAVFYNQSEAVLKLPNRIISVFHVDEVGQVWFFVNSPGQYLTEFEQEIPTRLDFLRKGIDYFLKIEGKAYMVTDPEEINALVDVAEDLKEEAGKNKLLLKVKPTHFEYVEREIKPVNNWVDRVRLYFHRLLHSRRLVFRLYPLQPETVSI